MFATIGEMMAVYKEKFREMKKIADKTKTDKLSSSTGSKFEGMQFVVETVNTFCELKAMEAVLGLTQEDINAIKKEIDAEANT